MIGCCGLFVPLAVAAAALHAVARVTAADLRGVVAAGNLEGRRVVGAHLGDVAALVLVFAICTALSAKVFRWE